MKKKIVDGVSASVSAPTVTNETTASTAATATVIKAMNDPSVKECLSLLGQVSARVGDSPSLDGSEVRRATKMKKAGAGIIPQILALCAQKGVTQIGSLTTQEMSEQLARGDALVQVGKHAGVLQKQVNEAGMSAHGRTWQIAMTMYNTLQRMAVDDPELALGLQPVQEFFRPKKSKGTERATAKKKKVKELAKETGETAETPGTPAPVAVAEPAPPAPPAAPAAAAATPAAAGGAH